MKTKLIRNLKVGRVSPLRAVRLQAKDGAHGVTRPAIIKRAALLLLFSTLNFQPSTFAQGTAFTYQGRLNDGPSPANGSYDMTFALFNVPSGAGQVGNTLTNSATAVSNGLFTVTLDFGNQFPGADRWLEIGVRTNGGGVFTTLTPRQQLTPTPYAITAANVTPGAGLSGTYGGAVTMSNAANQFTGAFSGNGASLANVDATTLGGLGAANFWIVGGNAVTGGASLGTGDNQPLNFISWNSRALRLETKSASLGFLTTLTTVNVLGGAPGNVISNGVMGGTIAGGGAVTNLFLSSSAAPNMVLDNFGTIGGGINNTAGYASTDFDDAPAATVAGGQGNTAGDAWTTVGGGYLNSAVGLASTVGGGVFNAISNNFATVSGGGYNVSSGEGATVPGGFANYALGTASFAGGDGAQAQHDGTFVWADIDPDYNSYLSTGTNQFCVRARGGMQLAPNTSVFCGSQTRQMLNLYGSAYGIGIQSATLYFRTDAAAPENGFIWYRGGVHNDAYGNAGGGTELMRLSASGLTVAGSVSASADSTEPFQASGAASGFSFADRTTGAAGRWVMFATGGTLGFYSGGSTRMSVSAAGAVTALSFTPTSDRNAKEHFQPVNARDVLNKVAALPISEWNFKAAPGEEHLGPMAQDFHAAFGLGTDDKHIATVDADGVALAAIQGLNQKLEEQTEAIKAKDARIAGLEQRLSRLEEMISIPTENH